MKSEHEKTAEIIPEYLRNSLSPQLQTEVDSHLERCEDCREEADLLLGLEGIQVPDPGEEFWTCLPAKVTADAGRPIAERSRHWFLSRLFFSPVPMAAMAVLALLLVYSLLKEGNTPAPEVFTGDPLAYSLLDYSDVEDDEMPLLPAGDLAAEEYLSRLAYGGQSYLREIVSLDPDELANLYEILGSEEKGGRI